MSDPLPLSQADAKTLAAELAAALGREQGGALLERARAMTLLNANKPGTQTSEFKMACLGAVVGLVLVLAGAFNSQPELQASGLDLVQWSVAGYAVSRGIAKAGAAKQPPAAS